MSCEHDCPKTPVFPRAIHNRPALDRIDYRIGMYTEMRALLLDRLNNIPELLGWTHRGADDPGIALLESTAVVGDILTFYQDLYANEAFLRTAAWRESVRELVQLLGYRLAPGVGGESHFALSVKGDRPVTVPAGFGFKAKLEGSEQAAEFESDAALVAHPHLGSFHLYRPRRSPLNITAGAESRTLELDAVAGKRDVASLAALDLKPGDRLMLVPESDMFQTEGTVYSPQGAAEILVIAEIEQVLDRTVITFEGSLTVSRGSTVRAYVIGRSFAHFGYEAPPVLTRHEENPPETIQSDTNFYRQVHVTTDTFSDDVAPFYAPLAPAEMALERELDDLAAGTTLICQGILDIHPLFGSVPGAPFTVAKRIQGLYADTLSWGNQSGSATVAVLDGPLITNPGALGALIDDPVLLEEILADEESLELVLTIELIDIRKLRFHEALSPELTLRAPTAWVGGAFDDSQLGFFGTRAEAKALEGRTLLLDGGDGEPQLVQAADPQTGLSLSGRDAVNPWMWTVELNDVPGFPRDRFDESEPLVTVHGNVVEASQGKSEDEVVLGSGDQRLAFQTFPVPKTPLTYLLDETQTPAQVPELMVYVGGILWTPVDTFFDSGPDDQVYVVREDDDGASWVQFGDGVTGARLPSGRNNVVGLFRTGHGATGLLEAGAKPSATGDVKEVNEVFMPGPAVGGGQPEAMDGAREAAPGRMQSLGRLVSLADFEAEALAIPGVLKTRAAWSVMDGVPVIRLTVLTEKGGAAALAKVRDTMRTYNRCRGPARVPILTVGGALRYVYVDMRAGYAAAVRPADVEQAIRASLGVRGAEGEAEDGLFALAARGFGEDVHVSQIIAAAQNVDGVTWVEVDAAQAIRLQGQAGVDPLLLPKPHYRRRDAALGCGSAMGADCVLGLHERHFDLKLALDERAEACAP